MKIVRMLQSSVSIFVHTIVRCIVTAAAGCGPRRGQLRRGGTRGRRRARGAEAGSREHAATAARGSTSGGGAAGRGRGRGGPRHVPLRVGHHAAETRPQPQPQPVRAAILHPAAPVQGDTGKIFQYQQKYYHDENQVHGES